MIRALALAGGLCGAAALSQFPEYSQQYLQRLAGAVDELSAVVAAFDASAEGVGLTRAEALDEMGGSTFQTRLRADMQGNIARLDRLSADYAALSGTVPLERLAMVWRMRDGVLAARTWADFQPALPLTQAGVVSAGLGFGTGWLGITAGLGLLSGLFRRRVWRARTRATSEVSPEALPREEPVLRRTPGNLAEYLKSESQQPSLRRKSNEMFEM
ncbi:MAG: hypothetical protein CSA73_01145 [Rhodobacterales bacterium]|nr:MAG: hypothetical protein CSA73_01145 [Rhodobacterales bacterium]